MARMIDGEAFKNMMIASAQAVEERKEEINSLNVFPVPDGDTGTNMALTLQNGAAALTQLESPTLGRALEVTASSLLRGARGNSGVITSLIFRGIAKHMKSLSQADGKDLAEAISAGAETAYAAVMKPAEGTMLTVCRVCGEAAQKAARKNREPEYVLSRVIEAGKKALDETEHQNPVLEKAGVVDAGAFGLLIIFGAMHLALTGKLTQFAARLMPTSVKTMKAQGADFSQFEGEEITYAYCTEFIAEKEDKRRSVDKLRIFLNSIGDSVVVVDDEEIVKVHVHTDTPDKALAEGLKFGGLSAIKIDNMEEQMQRQSRERTHQKNAGRTVAAPDKRYGFVAVAAGEGICDVFRDLGVDVIVEGGQTMNPSTDDLLNAIDSVPAEVVFVLPNNKNIIMAAQQAERLASKEVFVLPTKTIPQGMGALLSFEEGMAPRENAAAMESAAEAVRSGSVTYAARDSEFDGKRIREGDFLALEEGKLLEVGRRSDEVLKKLVKSMSQRGSAQFVSILWGEGGTEAEAMDVKAMFEHENKDVEVNVIPGGQPVYSYILSVE